MIILGIILLALVVLFGTRNIAIAIVTVTGLVLLGYALLFAYALSTVPPH